MEKATNPGARQTSANAARSVEAAVNKPRSNNSRMIGHASAMSSTAAIKFTSSSEPMPWRSVARNSG